MLSKLNYKKILYNKNQKKMIDAIKSNNNHLFDKMFNYLKKNEHLEYMDHMMILSACLENKNEYVLDVLLDSIEKKDTPNPDDLLDGLSMLPYSFEIAKSLSFKDTKIRTLIDIENEAKSNTDKKIKLGQLLSELIYWSIHLDRDDLLDELFSGGEKQWYYNAMKIGVFSFDEKIIDYLIDKTEHDKVVEMMGDDINNLNHGSTSKLQKGLLYYTSKKTEKENKLISKIINKNNNKAKPKARKI